MITETKNYTSETLRQGKTFKTYQKRIVEGQEKEIKNLIEGFEPVQSASDSSKPLIQQVKNVQEYAMQLNQFQTQFASTLERYKTAHAQLMSVTNTYLKDNQKLASDSMLNKNIFVNQVSSNTTAEYVGAYTQQGYTPETGTIYAMDYQLSGNIPDIYDACKKKATEKGMQYFGLQKPFGVENGNGGSVGFTDCYTSNDFNKTTKFGAGGNGCTLGTDNYQYGTANGVASVYQTPTSTAKYVGTYGDNPDRAMDLVNGGSNSFSFQTCLNEAIKTKSKFFALQDGNAPGNAQCALSNDWTKASKYGKVNNFSVASDGYKYGGGWANSIYEVNTTTPKYIGCYNVNNSKYPSYFQRLSPYSSVSECQKKATDSNFKYFGLSGGTNGAASCAGGNNLSEITKYGQSNPVFNGSDGKIYGSAGVNAVYKFKNTGYPDNVGKAGYVDSKGLLTEYPKSMISVVNGVPSIQSGQMSADNSCPKEIMNVDSNVWQNQNKASNMMTTTTKCGLSSAIQADQTTADELGKQLKDMSAYILSLINYLETLDDSVIKQMGLNKTTLNDMLLKYTAYNTQFSQYKNVDISNYDNIVTDTKIVTSQQNYNYILWCGITVVVLIILLQVVKRTNT